jgi:transposase-like protein
MARKARNNRSPEFKAKVALAAAQGQQTAAQLATLYGVHPIQITQWKKQLFAGASGIFASGVRGEVGQDALVGDLYEQIGRLNMELTWLKKKVSGLG